MGFAHGQQKDTRGNSKKRLFKMCLFRVAGSATLLESSAMKDSHYRKSRWEAQLDFSFRPVSCMSGATTVQRTKCETIRGTAFGVTEVHKASSQRSIVRYFSEHNHTKSKIHLEKVKKKEADDSRRASIVTSASGFGADTTWPRSASITLAHYHMLADHKDVPWPWKYEQSAAGHNTSPVPTSGGVNQRTSARRQLDKLRSFSFRQVHVIASTGHRSHSNIAKSQEKAAFGRGNDQRRSVRGRRENGLPGLCRDDADGFSEVPCEDEKRQ
ncbi:hypothetical protein BC835DRAFT_1306177 [Cytidiella melzeri]|nr:hypothetical protein BC835DRAFT_1306177 [Cytidiella melzeri]